MTPDPLLKYSLSQIQKAVLTHNQNKLALTCFWQSGSGSQTQWCNGSKYRGRKKLNPGERGNMQLFFSPLWRKELLLSSVVVPHKCWAGEMCWSHADCREKRLKSAPMDTSIIKLGKHCEPLLTAACILLYISVIIVNICWRDFFFLKKDIACECLAFIKKAKQNITLKTMYKKNKSINKGHSIQLDNVTKWGRR